MATPTVYRWDDTNAPVLSGQRNSLVNLLKACLVDGYGSKAAAGWTNPYTSADGYRAAFRNAAPSRGLGMFLYVNGASPASAYQVNLQGYEVMTDIDTGIGPFLSAAYAVLISNVASTASRPWVLIATDRSFYFICYPSMTTGSPAGANNYLPTIFFFGDINPYSITDGFACCLSVGYGDANYMYGLLRDSCAMSGNLGTAESGFPRAASGNTGTRYNPLQCTGGGPGSAAVNYTVSYSYLVGVRGPAYGGANLLLSQPFWSDSAVSSLRGWSPGLFYPQHSLASATYNTLDTLTFSGRSFLVFRQYSTTTVSTYIFFIEITEGAWP